VLTVEEEIEFLKILETEYREQVEKSWLKGDLTFKFHKGQNDIYRQLTANPNYNEALILCSRQWGKSYFVCVLAVMFCLRNPFSLVRIAAPTLKQATDIVADTLESITRDAPPNIVRRMSSAYRWYIGRSTLRLGVLEKAHVDTLRGSICHLAICEEGGFVTSDDYEYAVKSVLGPQLLHTKGRLIHVTTPSENPEHYIHTSVMPRMQDTGFFFRHNIYSNPRLTQDQIDAARTLAGGEDSIAWKREYLVEILRDASSVCVPEFNETEHVFEVSLPEHYFATMSMDVGGVRDKTVALILVYDFLNNRILVVDERSFDANTSSDRIIAEVREMEKGHTVTQRITDAPGQLLVDFMNKHNYNSLAPLKDDFHAGINAVRLMFRQNKIVVLPKCRFLIATLRGAVFNKARTDFNRTEYLGHMDALAALIYGVRMIDKTQNPYPEPPRDYQHTFYTTDPKPRDGLEQLASTFGKR
jgi:hypothetical protein